MIAGCSKELSDGDRIYLLATDTSEFVSVSLGAAAEQQVPAPSASAMQAGAASQTDHQFKPAVVLLVGPPGAGKSTFAEELRRRVPGCWQRINQVPATSTVT